MVPEKSMSGIAGVARTTKGRSCMTMLAPGCSAQCDMRIRTCSGEVMVGIGRDVTVRMEEGWPGRVCVHAFIFSS
jgi:hypothetical protein